MQEVLAAVGFRGDQAQGRNGTSTTALLSLLLLPLSSLLGLCLWGSSP